MKKFMSGNIYLLLLSLISTFSLMSCQEDEIIPIDKGADFDVSTAQDVIVNQFGETIGYYDKEFNRFDKEGMLVNDANQKDNFSPIRFSIYQHTDFEGNSYSFFSSSKTGSKTFSSGENLYKQGSSIVFPQKCQIKLYNQSGSLIKTFNADPDHGSYIESFVTLGINDQVTRVDWNCTSNGNNLCGYAYKGSNYTGARLPLMWRNPISYNKILDYGYNNNISSVSSNSKGKCVTKGKYIRLANRRYDKVSVDYSVEPIVVTGDRPYLSSYSYDNVVSSIIPGGDYQNRIEDSEMSVAVALDFLDTYNNPNGRTAAWAPWACSLFNAGSTILAVGGIAVLTYQFAPACGAAVGLSLLGLAAEDLASLETANLARPALERVESVRNFANATQNAQRAARVQFAGCILAGAAAVAAVEFDFSTLVPGCN